MSKIINRVYFGPGTDSSDQDNSWLKRLGQAYTLLSPAQSHALDDEADGPLNAAQDLDKEAYARVVFKAVGASIEASLADRASLMRAYLPLELAALRAVPLPFLQALLSPQVSMAAAGI